MNKIVRVGFLAAVAVLPLMGCGSAKSIINDNIPAIPDMLKLDGQPLVATMGEGRAVISGHRSVTVNFPNTSVSQANQLASMVFAQSLEHEVTVTVPAGKALPTSFPVSNLTLGLVIAEGIGTTANQVDLSATVAGPVTFSRISPTSNVYAAEGPVAFSTTVTGAALLRALTIITGGPSPNAATARLSVDTDDTKLPSGSTVTFRFYDGSVKPKI